MSEPSADALDRMAGVELVLMDVDGVLTDGRLYYDARGEEMRAFHARDGLGIRIGQRGGLLFGIVSGRDSPIVSHRAEELYITEVHQGIADKETRVRQILDRLGIAPRHACFVGDDIVDVPAMRLCGLAVAPADAPAEVRDRTHWVTTRSGGRGCVRELIDRVLRAQGRWETATARYFASE